MYMMKRTFLHKYFVNVGIFYNKLRGVHEGCKTKFPNISVDDFCSDKSKGCK